MVECRATAAYTITISIPNRPAYFWANGIHTWKRKPSHTQRPLYSRTEWIWIWGDLFASKISGTVEQRQQQPQPTAIAAHCTETPLELAAWIMRKLFIQWFRSSPDTTECVCGCMNLYLRFHMRGIIWRTRAQMPLQYHRIEIIACKFYLLRIFLQRNQAGGYLCAI